MSEKVINVTLPAFAFVESSGHDGDALRERNVILHVRSASVIEIFKDGNFFPCGDALTLRFKNTNALGLDEHYIAVLHYTATLDVATDRRQIVDEIITPAAKPSSALFTRSLSSPFITYTHAPPSAVPRNGRIMPTNVQIFMFFSFS